jgi:hypothetical protein
LCVNGLHVAKVVFWTGSMHRVRKPVHVHVARS